MTGEWAATSSLLVELCSFSQSFSGVVIHIVKNNFDSDNDVMQQSAIIQIAQFDCCCELFQFLSFQLWGLPLHPLGGLVSYVFLEISNFVIIVHL